MSEPAAKTREFSFMVTTQNPGEDPPPPVTWACRHHPTDWWHEVGCPHVQWTKEQLQEALVTAKQSHAMLLEKFKRDLPIRITGGPDASKLPTPEEFRCLSLVTIPERLKDVDPVFTLKAGHEPYMNEREIIQYEIHASFAGWIFAWIFGDLICARYFVWKATRKWKRYREHMAWKREQMKGGVIEC